MNNKTCRLVLIELVTFSSSAHQFMYSSHHAIIKVLRYTVMFFLSIYFSG